MIDKLTPKFLDKSSDYKLVRKTSLIDALNIYIDTETGEDNSGGVIKPIKGTEAIGVNSNDTALQDADYKALGSVTDQNTGVVYFFVWSSTSTEQGIWAYDPRGILPSRSVAADGTVTYNVPVAGKMRRILSRPEFNFPRDGFVKGDIVYSNTREFENHDIGSVDSYPQKDVLLYFTDNKNEPRKINVYRALLDGSSLPLVDSESPSDRQVANDFICACPRVPLKSISFTFQSDEDVEVNNFATAPGFQFAYQNIYADGLESAISPYSDIAFPPSVINRGAAATDNLLAHNKCVLRIPAQNQEVKLIKILARYGNGANFIEIDEVENVPNQQTVFDFYNDRIAGGVSPQTVDKTFDNVPQRAQAQVVASNRLAYGNYVEGYDNVDCSGVVLEPQYLDRPIELLDYVLDITPSIEATTYGISTPQGEINSYPVGDTRAVNYGKNKTAGFEYDVSQFADETGANTRVRISFSLSPDKNFHIYNFDSVISSQNPKSYHQSRQLGSQSLALPGYKASGVVTNSPADQQERDGYGHPAYQTELSAGAEFLGSSLQSENENYFGFNKGVGDRESGDPTWETVIGTNAPGSGQNDNVLASPDGVPGGLDPGVYTPIYGTSAGNPLIIQGGTIPFSVEFVINNSIGSGARNVIQTVFEELLEGYTEAEVNASLANLGDISITVIEVNRVHDHEIDLGLEEYSPINVTDAYSYLVSGVGVVPTTASPAIIEDTLTSKPPSCAFIVNKATARFYLEKVPRGSGQPRKSGMFPAFRLCLASVDVPDQDAVMTCVRDLDPASPWWPVKPSTISSPDFVADFNGIVGTEFKVPNRVFWEATAPIRNFVGSFPTQYDVDPLGPASQSGINRVVGEAMFGFMTVPDDGIGLNLLGKRIDTNGVVQDGFEYSLLDGEGGPGGSGAGEGSAYDSLGNDKYGSIAGQCFVGFSLDGGATSSEIPFAPKRGYNVYTAFGNQGGIMQSSLAQIKRGSVASALDLGEVDGAPDRYRHRSVLCGPYYTGKIVMNTVAGDNPQLANVNPSGTAIPNGVNMTTTLPLVWHSSWSKFSTDNVYDEGPWIENEFGSQVTFPYPVVQIQSEGGGGIIDGEFVEGTLEPNPFGYNDPFGTPIKSVEFKNLHSHIELRTSRTSVEDSTFASGLSFKSSATHELGIVYYDERGRHGYVNPIGSVYVKGYSEQDRGGNFQGPAFIKASGLNESHSPPDWARTYKFVYTKNTSMDKFIQYSAGGAFVANGDYQGQGESAIYVSLNYLQGHPISYSDAYGARGEDNTPVLYSFTPGDRLRVISYMVSQQGDEILRRYPTEAEFEVTGLVNLGENDNPFAGTVGGDEVVTEAMKGLFLVLKNNEDGDGFRYQDIDQGIDFWGNNCIFEIYSSVKELDADDRLYYEIGDAYNVVYTTEDDITYGNFHEANEVTLTQGDVFFRRHAVNLRDYVGGQGFVDLLDPADNDEETFAPESNFKNYYLESESATDLFPSRALSIGRPNIVNKDSRQSFREASIVHSDRDIVEARKIGYSSFNRSIPSDMEIDFKAGPINYMSNHQDSVFFVQKNKCGHIPVDRNLISDTSGTSSLIASSKFLGTPRYYAGQAGCDDNPESVVDVDNTAYFAHKSLGKAFKVNGANGVNVISDKNMSTFIKNAFDQVMGSGKSPRILGGYDPRKKEYLLTITENDLNLSSGNLEKLLDQDIYTPITVTGDTAFIEDIDAIDEGLGYDFASDSFVTIDWGVPSGLQDASWSITYSEGDASDPTADNILEQYSVWKSSPAGSSFPASTDLTLNVKIKNPSALDGIHEFRIKLEPTEFMTTPPGFNLSAVDASDQSNLKPLLNSESIEQGDGVLSNVYENGFKWPVLDTLYDEISHPPVGAGEPTRELTVTIDPADYAPGAPDKTIRIPVRFLCQTNLSDSNTLQSLAPRRLSFYIANTSVVRFFRQNKITIQALQGDFKKGGSIGVYTDDQIDLEGYITFQTNEEYVSYEYDEGIPAPLNLCHPDYGLWQFVEPGEDFTGGSLINWFASDNGFAAWAASTGLDVSDVTYDAMEGAIGGAIGQPLFCPNINYDG